MGHTQSTISLYNDDKFGYHYPDYTYFYLSSETINNIGNHYYLGIKRQTNDKKAVKYYKRSVDLGNTNAMSNLAFCYYDGIGVKQNYFTAFKLYLKAAKLCNKHAARNLAVCYYKGHGVEKNCRKAVYWHSKYNKKISVSAMTLVKMNIENNSKAQMEINL
jgi:TPR repeat protein